MISEENTKKELECGFLKPQIVKFKNGKYGVRKKDITDEYTYASNSSRYFFKTPENIHSHCQFDRVEQALKKIYELEAQEAELITNDVLVVEVLTGDKLEKELMMNKLDGKTDHNE